MSGPPSKEDPDFKTKEIRLVCLGRTYVRLCAGILPRAAFQVSPLTRTSQADHATIR